MEKTNILINRHHRDDSKELIGTIGALVIVGLGIVIQKAVTSIVKRKASSNKEDEILRAIRSGEINEQYFTREIKAQIVISIDRLFNQGALDAFFESNHIDPTKQKAYVNKIKSGVNKCQTLQQIINFLSSDSSFVSPTYFYGLETMNRLFHKAKTIKDYKIKDDNTDVALKIIDKTQSIVKKLDYPVIISYLAKIKNAVIGGNELVLNNTVGNVIDFFATKEFEAKYIDKDIKKANLIKVARKTINELYGLPIRDSKPYFKAKKCVMHKIKRHCDGFKDILSKLIFTIKQYIEKFKQLDSNKKIIVLLNKALQSAMAISMAKNAVEIKKNLKSLKYWGEKINQEKSRNPEYEPSADNIYYRRQAQVIAQGSAIIVKLIAILVSNKFEKKIINSGNDTNGGDDMIVTHDSMPWAKKRYSDKSNKNKEQIKKIERNIEEAKKNVKVLKTSKNPKVVKKAQKVDSELDKLKKQLKVSVRGALISMAQLSIAFGSILVISIATQAIYSIITMPFNFIARRARERGATERFIAWHRQNGPAPRPNGPAPTPLSPDNSRVMNAANGLRNAVSNIQNAVQNLEPSNERAEGGRFGSLDINGNNGAPTSSPGEYGGRFSGLDLDSKYWVTSHDCMPWSRDHRDYGVKGMRKGKHLKAKDDPKQAGGVQKKNAAAAQPSRAAKIAKILGGAALLGGGAYLAGKGLANMTRNRGGQSSTQSRPAASSSSSHPSGTKPSKSFSFKSSSSPELSSLEATRKALSDPNHVWDI